MQSLRTRKPSEAQSGSKRTATIRKPNPAARDPERRATRVGEKMRKRMSMRYADISAPTDALVPDVPALPIGVRASGSSRQTGQEEIRFTEEPREDTSAAELKLLDKDDFDPDACACVCIEGWDGG